MISSRETQFGGGWFGPDTRSGRPSLRQASGKHEEPVCGSGCCLIPVSQVFHRLLSASSHDRAVPNGVRVRARQGVQAYSFREKERKRDTCHGIQREGQGCRTSLSDWDTTGDPRSLELVPAMINGAFTHLAPAALFSVCLCCPLAWYQYLPSICRPPVEYRKQASHQSGR